MNTKLTTFIMRGRTATIEPDTMQDGTTQWFVTYEGRDVVESFETQEKAQEAARAYCSKNPYRPGG